MRRVVFLAVLIVTSSAPTTAAGRPRVHDLSGTFIATAYCRHGETQSGTTTRSGIVATDPRLLPTGSVIRLHGGGDRARTYRVEDHGVHGRHLDIFMPSCRAAKRFGKRLVRVHVLRRGEGKRVRSDGR